MERPALQWLLAEIKQGLIDLLLVYKVDRLTRSLTDFAKMVEAFDAHSNLRATRAAADSLTAQPPSRTRFFGPYAMPNRGPQ
jgi:DNA invertase Pin-like site-specific DNA recombinase